MNDTTKMMAYAEYSTRPNSTLAMQKRVKVSTQKPEQARLRRQNKYIEHAKRRTWLA